MDPLTAKGIFLAGLIVVNLLIRPRYIRQHQRMKIRVRRRTEREKALLMGVSLGYCVLPLVYTFTPWLAFADHEIPGWIGAAGVALLAAGTWLFWRAHVDLGANWSPVLDLREEHQLVTHGVYRRIRHPMYSALWLIVLAQAMILPNGVAGFSGLVAFGLLYFLRVRDEERMMMEQFGRAYEDYMRNTGRLLPKL